MYEINILIIAQTVKKRTIVVIHKLVPAHVWDNKVRLVYLVNIAANKAKTLALLELIAFLEKKLHSKAYAKERLYFSLLLDSVDKTAKTEHIHCPWERSHTAEVLLMDEPTSALDPISTIKIEELATELKKNYTIVIVTHNMQQATRISDKTAFFLHGEIVEFDETQRIFSNPKEQKTLEYITGRFG